MLHLLYIIAFTIIAAIAVSNLIRSLVSISTESQRMSWNSAAARRRRLDRSIYARSGSTPHPELIDDSGRPIDEPLLVMRSVDVEDAREKLDALYKNSPGGNSSSEDEL